VDSIKRIRKTASFPLVIVGTAGTSSRSAAFFFLPPLPLFLNRRISLFLPFFFFVLSWNKRSADEDEKRSITQKEGMSIAYRYKCPFVEVSAKTGENVDALFTSIVQEAIRYRSMTPQTPKKGVKIERKASTTKVFQRILCFLSSLFRLNH
jgi:hypothetical protein